MHGAGARRTNAQRRKRKELYVGIVGACASIREALARSVGAMNGFRAVDCGSGDAQCVARIRDLGIRLVLASLDPGPASSFVSALQDADPTIRTVVLLRGEAGAALDRLAAAGVAGFVPPAFGLRDCARALRTVRARGYYRPGGTTAAPPRRREIGGDRMGNPTAPGLHGRQLEVAEFVSQGLSNKEIADRLRISEGTVKSHVHAVLAALGVQRRWHVGPMLREQSVRLGFSFGVKVGDR